MANRKRLNSRIERRASFVFSDSTHTIRLVQHKVTARRVDDMEKGGYEIDLEVEIAKLDAKMAGDMLIPEWWDDRQLVGVLIADIDGWTPGRMHWAEDKPEMSEREEILAAWKGVSRTIAG